MLVKSSPVKTDEKKLFKTSAFSESVSVVSPLSAINGLSPSLDFVWFLTYVQNDLDLLLASFAMSFSKFLLNLLLRFCAAFLFLVYFS